MWSDPVAAIAASRGAPAPSGGARAPGQPDVGREADRLVLAEFAPPGVVVTDDLAVFQFRGQTGSFLEPTPGVASLDLLRLAREELRLPLRRAVDKARSTQGRVREPGVALQIGEARRSVSVEVIPFAVHAMQQRFFLVLFADVTEDEAVPVAGSASPPDVQAAEIEARLKVSRVRHRAARGDERGAEGGQRGDRLEQRGASQHERGATEREGGAPGDERGASHRQ